MNVLIIMSDEHSHQVMGCSGHPIVKTPNLDRLAREGSMFTQCYTNSPLCTPARASFFTGQYVHQMGTWDNATPYDGRMKGISHTLYENGRDMASFGKLDFHPGGCFPGLIAENPGMRDRADVGAFFRDSLQPRPRVEDRFKLIKVRDGECSDDQVRDDAVQWLKTKKRTDEPWVLNVGFLHPHFPFLVRKEHWDEYDPKVKGIPNAAKAPYGPLNEPLRAMRKHFNADVADEETVRKSHVGYYSLVTEMDANVGMILQALDEQGLTEDTLIIYTSDHGEQLGNHGMWFKCCMFEESVRIPMIVKGPGVQKGVINDTLLSLVDIYPSICDALNIPAPPDIQGKSWMNLARGKKDVERNDFVFSEYHAHGMSVGMFMIRWNRYKYVYYTEYKPQLFDLLEDPGEMNDLNQDNAVPERIQRVLDECDQRLRRVCDPEAVDRRARAFQLKMKKRLGVTDYTRADASSLNREKPEELPVPYPEYIRL